MIRNAARTRQRLIQAAFWEIYLMGFRSSRLDQILEEAGVTRGALYHHFPGKAALGHAVVEEMVRPLIYQWWIRPLGETGDPLQGLLKMLETLVEDEFTALAVERGCPLHNLGQEMAALDPAFRQRLEAILEGWRSRVAQTLEAARKQALVRTDLEPPPGADPIEGLTPACRQRRPNSIEVHCAGSRGRPFSAKAMASSWSGECLDRSVPLGKYWRSRPFVFSFIPRCQGRCGSQRGFYPDSTDS